MTPYEMNEITLIARNLLKFGLSSTADRLMKILEPFDDEKIFRIQDGAKQTHGIPWGLAEILYPAYGHGQTLEELHNRGGFGRMELGQLASDSYAGDSESRVRPRLPRMPLLDLYDMARRVS